MDRRAGTVVVGAAMALATATLLLPVDTGVLKATTLSTRLSPWPVREWRWLWSLDPEVPHGSNWTSHAAVHLPTLAIEWLVIGLLAILLVRAVRRDTTQRRQLVAALVVTAVALAATLVWVPREVVVTRRATTAGQETTETREPPHYGWAWVDHSPFMNMMRRQGTRGTRRSQEVYWPWLLAEQGAVLLLGAGAVLWIRRRRRRVPGEG
jgi:hypothetical protein